MQNWNKAEPQQHKHLNFILFCTSSLLALLMYLIFHPQIDAVNQETPIIINIMFLPAMAIGFLYGTRITQRAIKPDEQHSKYKRPIIKIFLFFFVIGGMFSSVNFAMNGGSVMPDIDLFNDGLIDWVTAFITANGGATFLIISSITLMAAATKKMVGLDSGVLNRIVTFLGTFTFMTMLVLSFTKSDPTASSIFLYTFYQAGIVGGAFYTMNKLTKHQNMFNDFTHGY